MAGSQRSKMSGKITFMEIMEDGFDITNGAVETSKYQGTSQAADRDPNPCLLSEKAGDTKLILLQLDDPSGEMTTGRTVVQ